MKQIVQSLKNGELRLKEVPTPVLSDNGILVKTMSSLISLGTEKMLIDLARKSIIGKAKERPDQVREVLDKVKKEGIVSTYQKVTNKLEEPMPLGYSCAGIVIGVGKNCNIFNVGDRVACAGATYANHAEVNFIPKNLAAKIPANVSFEEASYTTLASIALQGVRQANPKLGDNVFVIGLGLLGLITVQLLKANGCRIFGSDMDPDKVELAKSMGIDFSYKADEKDIVENVLESTNNYGVDSVIITASSDSNKPVELAAELARRKAKVIAVGMFPMDIPRNSYYLKELDFRLSMSYGPGRYDPIYEEQGIDYPYEYVRWTERRNMEAILQLFLQQRLSVSKLTTHRFKFDDAEDVYNKIMQKKDNYLGVLFEYNDKNKINDVIKLKAKKEKKGHQKIIIGLIGAGNYAGGMLYPQFKYYPEIKIHGISTARGISAESKGKKYGAELITTNYRELLRDQSINLVFITTRHNLHAEQIIASMNAGKNVFVEKPIALSDDELVGVKNAYDENDGILMVGYNRRYSELSKKFVEHFADSNQPINILYRISAGIIPKDHWIQDPLIGGGRIIGEVCHFVDYLMFLTNSLPVEVYARALSSNLSESILQDNVSISIKFENGSIGTIIYSAHGGSRMEKEYMEAFSGDKSAKLLDFRELKIYSGNRSKRIKLNKQDKGQKNSIKQLINLVKGNIRDEEYLTQVLYGSLTTFKILESLKTGAPVHINFIEKK